MHIYLLATDIVADFLGDEKIKGRTLRIGSQQKWLGEL